MGRTEKKFQKKKEREREVRKKILLKRAKSREQDKEMKKQRVLEKVTNKKTPIRRLSPEAQKTLELAEKAKEPTIVRGLTKDFVHIDQAHGENIFDEPIAGFGPVPIK